MMTWPRKVLLPYRLVPGPAPQRVKRQSAPERALLSENWKIGEDERKALPTIYYIELYKIRRKVRSLDKKDSTKFAIIGVWIQLHWLPLRVKIYLQLQGDLTAEDEAEKWLTDIEKNFRVLEIAVIANVNGLSYF